LVRKAAAGVTIEIEVAKGFDYIFVFVSVVNFDEGRIKWLI
jgi:hypothetical protein